MPRLSKTLLIVLIGASYLNTMTDCIVIKDVPETHVHQEEVVATVAPVVAPQQTKVEDLKSVIEAKTVQPVSLVKDTVKEPEVKVVAKTPQTKVETFKQAIQSKTALPMTLLKDAVKEKIVPTTDSEISKIEKVLEPEEEKAIKIITDVASIEEGKQSEELSAMKKSQEIMVFNCFMIALFILPIAIFVTVLLSYDDAIQGAKMIKWARLRDYKRQRNMKNEKNEKIDKSLKIEKNEKIQKSLKN